MLKLNVFLKKMNGFHSKEINRKLFEYVKIHCLYLVEKKAEKNLADEIFISSFIHTPKAGWKLALKVNDLPMNLIG